MTLEQSILKVAAELDEVKLDIEKVNSELDINKKDFVNLFTSGSNKLKNSINYLTILYKKSLSILENQEEINYLAKFYAYRETANAKKKEMLLIRQEKLRNERENLEKLAFQNQPGKKRF